MAALTSFHAKKCSRLASKREAYIVRTRLCSSVIRAAVHYTALCVTVTFSILQRVGQNKPPIFIAITLSILSVSFHNFWHIQAYTLGHLQLVNV